jgi:DNA repair protein RecO (recombination protein O)
MSLYRDRGVVLRTYKLGEADRIVVLLTPGHGKVRAVAKGVRRTKSRIGGRLEPLSHVELLLYEGRQLDIVSQAETIEPWRLLHEDLNRLSQGMAMVEAAEQVAQEREAAEPLYRMLVGALRALAERPSALLVASFYWKLLSLDGAGPILGSCASCGASPPAAPLVAFDIAEGGALCRDCRRGQPVSPAALELVRWILGGQLAKVLQLPASATTGEVTHLSTISLEQHLERHLRVLHALETI